MWRKSILVSLVTLLAFSFAFADIGNAIGEDETQIGLIKAKLENNQTLTWAEKAVAWESGLIEEQIAPPAYYNPSSLRTAYLEEGFETWPPAGWTLDPATGSGAWLQDMGDDHGPGSVVEGTYAAFFNEYDYFSGTTGTMTTPAIDLTSATAPRISFWAYDAGGSNVIDVLVSTDNTTFTSIYTTAITVTPWTEIIVDLTAYVGNATVYVQFYGYSFYGLYNPHIDAFSVAEAPTDPVIGLSAAAFDFGGLPPGMSADEVLTISNNGGADLNISSIISSDDAFTVDVSSGVVAAGATLDVTVTFSPFLATDYTADLTITSDDATSPNVVTLTGSGSATTGGPDIAGYTWVNSFDGAGPTYSWIDTVGTTDAGISFGDDYRGTIDLPFTFRFYGNLYTQITATTNAWLGMGPSTNYSSSYWTNTTLPSATLPDNIIAPLWDDFKAGDSPGSTSSAHGTILYKTLGTEPNRQFVVIFHEIVRSTSNTDYFTFEAILDEATSDISFQYFDVLGNTTADNGIGGTVGIENAGATDALLYEYNGSPQLVYDEMAIKFIAPPPPTLPNVVLDVSELNFGAVAAGGSVQADVTITNSGAGDLVISGVSVAAPFSSTFSGTIAAAGSAVATISFDPGTTGDYSETLAFTVTGDYTGSNELSVMGSAYPGDFVMEGFENSFPPFGWTILDIDGGSAINPDLSYIDPHTGDVAAEGMGCADDYLITPLLAIPAGYATLSFWVGQESVNYQNSFEIMVSTTGTATTDFVQVADFPMYTRGATDWTMESMDLSAYAGQDVYVAIHIYYSESSFYGFGFDDFIIPPNVPSSNTLFFSEYMEGSSNNKGLEIYNGSGSTVNLDDYQIAQSVNGGGWAFYHVFPVGATLENDDVWLIANDAVFQQVIDIADEVLGYPSVVHHNGDDARGLVHIVGTDTSFLDIIGVPTEDPGTAWDVAGVAGATANHNLVRKPDVVTGNIDWAASAGTTAEDSEWLVFDQDFWYGMGYHNEPFPGPGDVCELALDYGAANDLPMAGDLIAGSHDWYSFTTDGSYQQITASLCGGPGSFDSKLAVFADCADFVEWPAFGAPVGAIGYNDDECGLTSEVDLASLEAGTYYVAVYGYSATSAGTYELAVTGVTDPCDAFVDNYEPNNDMVDATVAADGDVLDAALCPTDDSDYYAVYAQVLGTITAETTPLSADEYATDTWLNLYDSEGTLLASNDDGGFGYTSLISQTVFVEGTYYFEVVVSSWAAGDVFDYTINITVEDPPLPVPQNLVAEVSGFGTIDLTWDPVPSVPDMMRVNDGVSPLKLSNPKNNLDPLKAEAMQVYARKQAEQQAFMVADALRDPGDTCGEAIDAGAVNSAPMIADLIAGDHEWYSFTTDGSYQQITVSTCASSSLTDPIEDSKLAVFADCADFVEWPASGAPVGAIGYNDDGCGTGWLSELDLSALEAGTYYVTVYGYGASDAGAYELAVTGVADPCDVFVDTYEPNNTMAEATVAVDGDMLPAALCPTEDTDWFAVSGLALGSITVETTSITSDDYATDTYLRLYDSEGTLLVSDDDGGEGYTSMIIFYPDDDGTYYFEVSVSSWAAGDVFDYALNVTVDDPSEYIPSFNVYRDDVLIAADLAPVDIDFRGAYTDAGLDFGAYCYNVTQNMADLTMSDPSDQACASITPFPAMDLVGSAGDAVVNLSWLPPMVIETGWISYHDGEFENGISSTNGGAGLATMFTPLVYPAVVEQVQFHVSDYGSFDQELQVYILADDGTTVLDGPYLVNGVSNDWIVIDNTDITLESGGFMVATYNTLAGGPSISMDESNYLGNLYFGDHTLGFTELSVYGFYAVGSHEAYVNYDGTTVLVAGDMNNSNYPGTLGTPSKEQTLASANPGSATINTNRSRYAQSNVSSETRDLIGYNVYRGMDAEELELLSFTTDTFLADLTVVNGTTYFYEVTATYDEGESVPTNMVVLTPLGAAGLPYFSDFEADGGGFNPADEWQWGAPTFVDGPAAAYSGSNVWGTVLDDYYPDNSDSWLVQPFDLSSAAGSAELSFAVWTDLETNWDYAYVALDHDNDGIYEVFAEYNGNTEGWLMESLTIPGSHLTAYAKLAFIFQSDGSVQYPGIYIDDLSVMATPSGVLAGTVTSGYDDALMEGVIIGAVETTTFMEFFTETLADGSYMMDLPVGNYDVGMGYEDYFPEMMNVDIILNTTTTLDMAMTPDVPAPMELAATEVAGGVSLSWTMPIIPPGDVEGFEGGIIPEDWSTVDEDGDGANWDVWDLFAHTGTYSLASFSWSSAAGPLTPNNYLISPQTVLGAGAELRFWVGASDASWYWEHFKLLLSTSGTNPADFTVELLDYTLTTDAWTEIVVDLSAYEGLSVHMAWVHNEVTDVFNLSLDDISLMNGDGEPLFSSTFETPADLEQFEMLPFRVAEDMTEEEIQTRLADYEASNATSSLRSELLFFKVYSNVGGAGWNIVAASNDPVYLDETPLAGQSIEYKVTAQYDIAESDYSNTVQLQVVGVDELGIPTEFALYQNYPNPFNPVTTITYDIPEASDVRLVIYNLVGQPVRILVKGYQNPSHYTTTWNGLSDSGLPVSSGIYIYRLESASYVKTMKMMYLK